MHKIGVLCEFGGFCGITQGYGRPGEKICGGSHTFVTYDEIEKHKYSQVIEVPQERIDMFMSNKLD
tara:strand:- start:116 stop:313 length:198 start_codon:yes stop_codon:yes gene_type:complete